MYDIPVVKKFQSILIIKQNVYFFKRSHIENMINQQSLYTAKDL